MGLKEILLGTITWTLIALIGFIPLTFLFLWKVVVILIAKCIRRDLLPLNALDAMNAPGNGDGDTTSIVNFGLVCRIEGEVNLEDLQAVFTEKFLGHEDGNPNKRLYERFHCSLVTFGGFAFFKRISRIDINEQICIKNLKENQQLEDLLSEWILTKYKSESPCWEIILIPLRATNQTAMAIKIHHAFADGYSLLYVLDELTGNTSPYLVKDFKESFGQKISEIIQAPCHLGKLKGAPENNPFACVKENPHRWRIGFTTMDLNLLKQIRRKHNVQFGSIILSLLGGTLRRYLLESKKVSSSSIPSHLPMALTLPWPRHPSKNPQTPTNNRICNHWVSGIVKVPVGEEDPVQRLIEVEKGLKEFQDLGINKFMHRIFIPLVWIIPVSLGRQMFLKDPGFVAGYSTTVGGDGYQFKGKKITHIHPILAIHDLNPFIPISTFSFSHENNFDLTFSANPQHFPDQECVNQVIEQYLPNELKRLSILSGIVEN